MKLKAALLCFIAILLATAGLNSCATGPSPSSTLADEYYNLGNAWFDLKKYELAERAYEKALTWNPTLRIATLNLARTKAELGDPSGALSLVEALQGSDKSNLIVQQYLAWLTARQKGAAAAADLYSDLAAKLPGDAATQFNAGVSLHAAQRTGEAKDRLLAWRELDGKSATGLALLAQILDQTLDPKAADAWLAAASALPAGDARQFAPLAARARSLEVLGQFREAITSWSSALALPTAVDQDRGEALFRLGAVQIRDIEDYAPGIENLLAAWKAGYHQEEAWKNLRSFPGLKFSVQLEADLNLAGIKP